MRYLDDQHDVVAYRDRDTAGSSLENHFHYVNEIILCHGGEATFSINGKDYRLREKSLIFIGNLESHSVRIDKLPYDRSVILLSHTYVTRYLGIPLVVSMLSNHLEGFPYVFQLDDDEYQTMKALTERTLTEFEHQQPYWQELIAGNIRELLVMLYRNHPDYFAHIGDATASGTVMKVQMYINEHFAEDITLQGLSDRFFTSPSSLSRDFKQFTGHTVKTYVILNRLLRAKFLLQTTNRSMISIAEEAGYDNPNHFSLIFKKYTEMTPMQYRRLQRGEDDVSGQIPRPPELPH